MKRSEKGGWRRMKEEEDGVDREECVKKEEMEVKRVRERKEEKNEKKEEKRRKNKIEKKVDED